MGKPSKQLMDFMSQYKIDSDEVWEVRTGGAWAIKHAALERVAAEQGISFDRPAMIEHDAGNKVVAICVFGKLGERTEWSIGEASPANNKNAYCYAMAEKRGKDRVILKLLNAHGTLYSDSEADEFERRDNPHVNKPEDFHEPTEYDNNGQPVDNIPLGDREVTKLTKSQARPDFANAQAEIRACKTLPALQSWATKNANRIASYPHDWQEHMRGIFADHLSDLRSTTGKAA